jgi:hypothetical protein
MGIDRSSLLTRVQRREADASTVWLPSAALRSIFVAARLGDTENHAEDPGNQGTSDN